MKSIFQAMDGGHLDRALFSSSKKAKDSSDENVELRGEPSRRFSLSRNISRHRIERTHPKKPDSDAEE